MWTRAAFGMVLHAKSFSVRQTNSLNAVVIEISMGDFDVGDRLNWRFVHAKTVIVGGDFRAASFEIKHGVINSSVTVVHFVGR